MRFLILVLFAVVAWCATPDELVILVKVPSQPDVATGGGEAKKSSDPWGGMTIEDVWKKWYNVPGQVWLDTPSGPKPLLGMDNVYDGNGMPVPRLPDPYTYAVVKNPQDPEAMTAYLDWRRAVIRRVNTAANGLPEHAYLKGLIGPETVAVPESRPTDQKAVGDYSKIEPASLGTPLVAPGKARELGMKADEIPRLPGDPDPSGIEVYWFWHHKCKYCLQMARDWFAFQRVVNQAGYKAVSINMSSLKTQPEIEANSYDVASTLEIWTITWGDDVDHSRNWLDWTSAGQALGITGTPTTVFINRKTLKIERLVGPQSPETLRASLASVAGWDPNQWPPPAANGQETAAAAAEPAAPAPSNVTPVGSWGR